MFLRDSIGNLDKVDLYCDVVEFYGVIPEAGLYCNVVGILLALYLKLLWRDVGDIDGVVCGEMLAHVYSVEPEILM